MVLMPGQLYVPGSAEEIRDDFLTDLRLEAIAQGVTNPPVQPDTEWYVLGTCLANISLVQYANLRLNEDEGDITTATDEGLERARVAYGLPEVVASPSSGWLLVDVSNNAIAIVPDGTQFLLPNGKRGKVVGTWFVDNVVHKEVQVVTIDTGEATKLGGGSKVRFVSPPLNIVTEATVASWGPLVGGSDTETPARKKDRILNRLQNIPQGGNWGYLIEKAMGALASVQYAFVYPALGGPASFKVVLVKDIDEDLYDFTRALNSIGVASVRAALHALLPDGMEVVVETAVEQTVDATITATLPFAASAGGNGLGWVDASPWPPLVGGDAGRVTITAYSGGTSCTVSAGTATSPLAGQTHIAWWSDVDQAFYKRLVTAVGGGAGAWVLTLDQPLTDHNGANATVGEYICPDAKSIEAYGKSWRTALRRFGPGENTADGNRLPRALRHPYPANGWPTDLTLRELESVTTSHSEISNAAWGYTSVTTPTVPGAVSTAPNILKPRRFAIYML